MNAHALQFETHSAGMADRGATGDRRGARRSSRRRGLTMIELLLASLIMSLLAATLGVMADAVYRSNEYAEGYTLAGQHARVIIERISRAVNEATANELNPGAMVIAETTGSNSYPDTLVVWNPTGSPASITTGPRVNELIVFTTNPSSPNELLEITDPTDTTAMPAYSDTSAWRTAILALRNSSAAKRVVLTDMLRVETATGTGNQNVNRGCVRFALRVLPSVADWSAYLVASDEEAAWTTLPWAQSIGGTETGLRQTWVRFEVQLMPGDVVANDEAAMPAAPFFGSGALYYQMKRR